MVAEGTDLGLNVWDFSQGRILRYEAVCMPHHLLKQVTVLINLNILLFLSGTTLCAYNLEEVCHYARQLLQIYRPDLGTPPLVFEISKHIDLFVVGMFDDTLLAFCVETFESESVIKVSENPSRNICTCR